MSRTREEKTKIEEVVYSWTEHRFYCDNCGREVSHEPEDDDGYAQVLEVYLNADLCVNQKFRKDYCRACLEPKWKAICELIGVDPEDMRGFDDED